MTADLDDSIKYVSLVQHVLWEFDNSSNLAERVGGGSPQLQGEIRGYQSILHFLTGFEGTDLDGLRERFAEAARSTPEGK